MFYPEDVKESVLEQILITSKPVAASARENNIPYSTAITWKINAQKEKTGLLSIHNNHIYFSLILYRIFRF